MTTSQLPTISPEWQVLEGEKVIRPRNPYIHCNGRYYDKDNPPPCCSECECDHWIKTEKLAKQHTYATDLLPGTYSAEQLKAVWEFWNSDDGKWHTLPDFKPSKALPTVEKWSEFIVSFYKHTRPFITKA